MGFSLHDYGLKWWTVERCGEARIANPNQMSADNGNAPTYNSRYDNVVDEKRRIQVPSKWRTPGETEFMLILWPNGAEKDACLMVLPPAAAQRLKEKVNALPFGDPQAEALRRFLGRKSDTVYSDKTGRITLPEQMAKAAGIEGQISPHSLRHTFATIALDAGTTLHDLQDSMGHADPRTTRRYDRARHTLEKAAGYDVARALA